RDQAALPPPHRPPAGHGAAGGAHRLRREAPRAAGGAAREAQLAPSPRLPVGLPLRSPRAAHELVVGHRPQSPRSSSAPVGTMLPLVTSDSRASGTWLHDVPRIWRTASMIRLMPCTYASDRLPPLVLFGKLPPTSRPPFSTNAPASPGLQKPDSSSDARTSGVKGSWSCGGWASGGLTRAMRHRSRAA